MTACKGKTALVTNAARAEGRAIAMALARAGARVLVHANGASRRAQGIVNDILEGGGIAKAIAADTAVRGGPNHLAQQTREIVGDRLDVLVLNPASPSSNQEGELCVAATFDAQLAVRARAPFVLVQQLLPILTSGSSVIFISPANDAESSDPIPAYLSASKSIAGLLEHFAVLLKPSGVRVNAVDLSGSGTSGAETWATSTKRAKASLRHRGLRVGAAVTFLASDESRQITGETINATV